VVLLRHSLLEISPLGGWTSVLGSCGLWFCYIALSAAAVYHLSVDQLRQQCLNRGLDSGKPVRSLSRRLVADIKSGQMDRPRPQEATQARVPTDEVPSRTGIVPPRSNGDSHGGSEVGQTSVLVELLRQVVPLSSEEPEEILRLFVRVGEIYELGLVDDRQFITRILPLVSGSLLKLLGGCLREDCSWADCNSRLLDEYFSYFVRDRLIRDLIVFNFQGAGQSMRDYLEQVFQAADFLQYEASERQLVDRVVMNFHPYILSQAAFLDRPRSHKQLCQVIGLIEEKFSVLKERQRSDHDARGESSGAVGPRGESRAAQPRTEGAVAASMKCWTCGQNGHWRRNCPQNARRSGNGRRPGGRSAPGQNS
jgi:hypothetical protein